ncbi:MAG TPA: hypothetical protein VKA38_05520 [Draconibacterium sp.]|nr:hypothetical protein [Draconibacterium sp.]
MCRKTKITTFIAIAILFFSCSSQKYFHDTVSRDRQMELKKHRSGNVFADIGLTIASMFVMTAANVNLGLYPEGQDFKKLKLINPTSDTLFVNMLTDVFWDKENYCDFMDIRIPPNEKCKILVPVDANYNLYFSNTFKSEDDEMLEINTNEIKKISLYPGLTKTDK